MWLYPSFKVTRNASVNVRGRLDMGMSTLKELKDALVSFKIGAPPQQCERVK